MKCPECGTNPITPKNHIKIKGEVFICINCFINGIPNANPLYGSDEQKVERKAKIDEWSERMYEKHKNRR